MGFDPICGDGTAHAIREAILASAVLRAAQDGETEDQLFAHYQARLIAGFRRHLLLCRDYYKSGGSGPWWASELDCLERGLEWCEEELRPCPEFQYRLDGFELRPIASATRV